MVYHYFWPINASLLNKYIMYVSYLTYLPTPDFWMIVLRFLQKYEAA